MYHVLCSPTASRMGWMHASAFSSMSPPPMCPHQAENRAPHLGRRTYSTRLPCNVSVVRVVRFLACWTCGAWTVQYCTVLYLVSLSCLLIHFIPTVRICGSRSQTVHPTRLAVSSHRALVPAACCPCDQCETGSAAECCLSSLSFPNLLVSRISSLLLSLGRESVRTNKI